MANGGKEVVFRSCFNIIKALIRDKSINWKVDSCIYSPWFIVDVLMTLNSLSAKSVLAGEKLVAMYSIST